MNSNCFPTSEVVPLVHPYIASPHLAELPQLCGQDVDYLSALIHRLRGNEVEEGEEEEEVEGPSSSLTIPAILARSGLETESLDEEDSDDDEEEEPELMNFLSCATLNIRPPSKRKTTVIGSRSSKKPRAETPRNVSIVSRHSPAKPPHDNNEYRVITLSNGLRAILIRKPLNPSTSEDDHLDDIMKSISRASMEQKRFKEERYLPENFPIDFPLVNLPLSLPLTEIINKKLEREMGNEYPTTLSSTSCEAQSTANQAGETQCTFGVSVNTGSCDSPWDCLGLAHFAEHMVHYGSEKYPGEETYFSFAFNHTNTFNAYTQNHLTTYYTTLSVKRANQGMDMMASMLSKPIFENDMTRREVNSVDSEFNLKRHVDFLRRWFLLQTALGDHPLGKFGCGNEDTLLEPKNVHKVLRDFHSKYYVASAMTVGLESVLPLADQETLILNNFGSLRRGQRKILRETPPTTSEKRIGGENFNMDYILQGLCNLSNLWVVWPIPEAFLENQGNKSMSVLLKLLGDEKKGSLSHYLRTNNYVWQMICNHSLGAYLMKSKYSSFVTLDFFLTAKGLANVDHIMKATYTYLDKLRDLPDSTFHQVFNEMKLRENRGEQKKTRQMKSGKFASAVVLAKGLQRAEAANVLRNDSWAWKNAVYRPGEVDAILERLNPKNMIAIQTLPESVKLRAYLKVSKASVETEEYGEEEYVVQPIEKRFGNLDDIGNGTEGDQHNFQVIPETVILQSFMDPPVQYGIIPPQSLALPFTLPAKVMHAGHYGNAIDNYRSVCIVNYINSEAMSTARNFAMSLLWITSTYLSLISNDPDTSVMLVPHSYGISIGIDGYSENVYADIEALNGLFFAKPVSQDQVSAAREALLTLYDVMYATNWRFITEDLLHFVNCNHTGDILSDALTCIKELSVSEINSFSHAFKSRAMAFLAVAGNVSIPVANALIELINRQAQDYSFSKADIFSPLFFSKFTRNESCRAHTTDLYPGEKCIRFKSKYCYSYTTTVANFFYVGRYDPAQYLLWWNSLYFFQERAFIELRIKQQLGYSIDAFFPRPKKNEEMVIGVAVQATGKKFSPCFLDKRLDEFMVKYGKFLDTVEEETFTALKKERGYPSTRVNVKLADAKVWYQEHFGKVFASTNPKKFSMVGMKKISAQFLGNDCKTCKCRKCEEIDDWHTGDSLKHLQFARGKGSMKDIFVDDPTKIRD